MIPNDVMQKWLDNDHKTLKQVKELLSNPFGNDEYVLLALCAKCVGIIEANEISNGIIAEEFNKQYQLEQISDAVTAAGEVF